MAWTNRDFRNMSMRVAIYFIDKANRREIVDIGKKANFDSPFQSKSLTDLYFIKVMVSVGITKLQKSYIELSDVLSIKILTDSAKSCKNRCCSKTRLPEQWRLQDKNWQKTLNVSPKE